MFSKWMKKLSADNNQKSQMKEKNSQRVEQNYIDNYMTVSIDSDLEKNKILIVDIFQDSSDFVIREFQMDKGPLAILCYIDGITRSDAVDLAMKALMMLEGKDGYIEEIQKTVLPVSQITSIENFGVLLTHVLSGDCVLLVDKNQAAVSLGLRGVEHRNVSEPETEALVRGPREGFNEQIRTNTALIRKKIKSPRLKMKPFVLGKETNTNIVVSYIEGLADPNLVKEVITRIEKIDIDGILESGYVEELIQDNGYSPFPQLQNTERPDTVAAALLEGRVAILVDGTPFALLAPIVFWQWIQASEDYYERFYISSFLRVLRLILLFVSLLLPAIYIAVSTFHPEMIPTSLLLSIAASRESIPFPAVIEALIMEVAFEALREAGIRLPKAIGQTVSILGALVVGQAAVQAGIVSASMVIVVSITGISSFTLPRYSAAISVRLLRFPLMILASIFGLLGIIVGTMLIIGHMAGLRSFGVPYLSPIAPLAISDFKDIAVRAPWWKMKTRPAFLNLTNKVRLGGPDDQSDDKKTS